MKVKVYAHVRGGSDMSAGVKALLSWDAELEADQLSTADGFFVLTGINDMIIDCMPDLDREPPKSIIFHDHTGLKVKERFE